MQTGEYSYKPKPLSTILAIILFLGGVVGFGYAAMHNDRGLIIDRIIELSAIQATIFFWVACVASAGFVLLSVLALFKAFSAPRYVRLTEECLIAPKSLHSREDVTVPYNSIEKLVLKKIKRQEFLYVHHKGKKLSIPKVFLPNKQAFDELYDKLAKNIAS